MKWRINPRNSARLALAAVLLTGCDRHDMYQQPKYEPLQPAPFFADGRSARPLEPDTVARGDLRTNQLFYTGSVAGQETTQLPLPLTADLLRRGQERFNIFCAPCHGRTGEGNGMIVQRGFRSPPSFHIARLRNAPPGHFYDVMTHGFGAMPDYAAQIPPADRWAIAAYVRALQLSQHTTLADVPSAERPRLQESPE